MPPQCELYPWNRPFKEMSVVHQSVSKVKKRKENLFYFYKMEIYA